MVSNAQGYVIATRLHRAVSGLMKEKYVVQPTKNGLYTVTKRDGGKSYKVRLQPVPSCTCRDWSLYGHGHVCKHALMAAIISSQPAYVGYRLGVERRVYVVRNGLPEPLQHIVEHSPSGFEWGYIGSGPADLAISILTDYLGDKEKALEYKGLFKSVVARLPHVGWILTNEFLRHIMAYQPIAA